ncbi:MAG: UDP-N-acetylmuramate dehydrogenase [Candidatus Komeilibacteria bacterium]|nr:UDP-N-acetylmuramate dehydrogenase [Candidatus Komeilibacteria bacterium]
MKQIIKELQKLNIAVKENEPLANHTTFQIGGPAKVYLEAKSPTELLEILKIIKQRGLKYIMIGGGSNLLVSDAGYDGAVIKTNPGELLIENNLITADAGCTLAGLIMKTLDLGLTGLEFAAGVPGTVGGAIKGNAGTYGEAMDKAVKTVDFINDNLEIETCTGQQCNFAYRHSIFKEHDSWLIVSAVLQLTTGDLAASRKLIDERLAYRTTSQPHGYPSAGCTFKNIAYTETIAENLKKLNWELSPKFKEYQKIPASWVIEKLDLKGKTIGKAQIAEKHANYIINLGGAKADDVIRLIGYIKQQVRDKTGIQLEEEVRYVGF